MGRYNSFAIALDSVNAAQALAVATAAGQAAVRALRNRGAQAARRAEASTPTPDSPVTPSASVAASDVRSWFDRIDTRLAGIEAVLDARNAVVCVFSPFPLGLSLVLRWFSFGPCELLADSFFCSRPKSPTMPASDPGQTGAETLARPKQAVPEPPSRPGQRRPRLGQRRPRLRPPLPAPAPSGLVRAPWDPVPVLNNRPLRPLRLVSAGVAPWLRLLRPAL